MPGWQSRTRPWLGIVIAASLTIVGVIIWNRAAGQQVESKQALPVVAVAPFLGMNGVEPWSGLGLTQQIRQALDTTLGVAVQASDGSARGVASYVLQGTVGRGDARSEIGVKLIRVRDRYVVWTGTFWRTSADLPSFPGELADAVAVAVRLDEKRATLAREPPR